MEHQDKNPACSCVVTVLLLSQPDWKRDGVDQSDLFIGRTADTSRLILWEQIVLFLKVSSPLQSGSSLHLRREESTCRAVDALLL